jgi:hypothetical protein
VGQNAAGTGFAAATLAGPDAASDTPVPNARNATKYPTRRGERVIMRLVLGFGVIKQVIADIRGDKSIMRGSIITSKH